MQRHSWRAAVLVQQDPAQQSSLRLGVACVQQPAAYGAARSKCNCCMRRPQAHPLRAVCSLSQTHNNTSTAMPTCPAPGHPYPCPAARRRPRSAACPQAAQVEGHLHLRAASQESHAHEPLFLGVFARHLCSRPLALMSHVVCTCRTRGMHLQAPPPYTSHASTPTTAASTPAATHCGKHVCMCACGAGQRCALHPSCASCIQFC